MQQIEELDDSALAAARERGRREALSFAARLAEVEWRERRELLELASSRVASGGAADSARLHRLERELNELNEFRHAVVHSRGWRLLQGLRRLVGRAW